MAGTITRTQVDTTTQISGTFYSPQIGVGPEAALAAGLPSWGMGTVAIFTGYKGIWVQLQTLQTALDSSGMPNSQPATFQLSNPASGMGQAIANVRFPIGPGAARYITFLNPSVASGSYSYLFAVNNGRIDANATPIMTPAGQAYNLCNFGLTQGENSQDTVSATLTYGVETLTL